MKVLLGLLFCVLFGSVLADDEPTEISPYCYNKLNFIVDTFKIQEDATHYSVIMDDEHKIAEELIKAYGKELGGVVIKERYRLITMIYFGLIDVDGTTEFMRLEMILCEEYQI